MKRIPPRRLSVVGSCRLRNVSVSAAPPPANATYAVANAPDEADLAVVEVSKGRGSPRTRWRQLLLKNMESADAGTSKESSASRGGP